MESDKEKLQKLYDLLKKIDPEEKVFKQETILNNNNNKEYKKELNNSEQNIYEKEHDKKYSSK